MPLVHIDMLEGRLPDYTGAVLDAVRRSLVEAAGASDERIVQRIHEVPKDSLDVPPGKTDQVVVIEVTMLAGRPLEKKRAFYDDLRERLAEDPGIPPEDVYIIVRDTPDTDLCLGSRIGATGV